MNPKDSIFRTMSFMEPILSLNKAKKCVFFFLKKDQIFLIYTYRKKNFLTKVKGDLNLFVIGEFLYSQYRNKEENAEGTKDLFLYRQIFVKSVFVRTIFDRKTYDIRSCHVLLDVYRVLPD